MLCATIPSDSCPAVLIGEEAVTETLPAWPPAPPAPPMEAEKIPLKDSSLPEVVLMLAAMALPPLPPLPPIDWATIPWDCAPRVVIDPVCWVTDTEPEVPPAPPPPPKAKEPVTAVSVA